MQCYWYFHYYSTLTVLNVSNDRVLDTQHWSFFQFSPTHWFTCDCEPVTEEVRGQLGRFGFVDWVCLNCRASSHLKCFSDTSKAWEVCSKRSMYQAFEYLFACTPSIHLLFYLIYLIDIDIMFIKNDINVFNIVFCFSHCLFSLKNQDCLGSSISV